MEGVADLVLRVPGTGTRTRPDPLDVEVVERGDVDALATLVGAGQCVLLTGAGMSTDSGIPDYRGPSSARRRHAPMTYAAFTSDPAARHRYWARGHVGWPRIAGARPNAGHHAVAALDRAGLLRGVVTQNVDRLHQGAGTTGVVDLHGTLARVLCLGCRTGLDRDDVAERLHAANPAFDAAVSARATAGTAGGVNPDGDVALPDDLLDRFTMIACPVCGDGPLKPDVVFFGESVPRDRVTACFDLVAGARSLVVLGSSLTVMSGLRFVRAAARDGVPVGVVTSGATRAEDLAGVRLDSPLGTVLPALVHALRC